MIDKFKKKIDNVQPVLNYKSVAMARILYKISKSTNTLGLDASLLFD